VTTRALLVDLDDTLYDYQAAEPPAREGLLARLAEELGLAPGEAARLWDVSRAAVKSRLGDCGSAHSRLLYLSELVHAAGRPDRLGRVRVWERAFWEELIRSARLRPGARELLEGWRGRGGRVAVVTDLTLEVQLWKLEAFGLLPLVDVVAASEEVLQDKPAPWLFLLAMERLGVVARDCVLVGDSPSKDGAGARELGIPYFEVRSDRDFARVSGELLR
jgi:HAD superfamily hydrolase (TIGR01549 family)